MSNLTYIDAMNRFMDLAPMVGLPANQRLLMISLLHGWNRLGRPNSWSQSTVNLCSVSGLSRKALAAARNGLSQSGFVEFKGGSRHRSAHYQLGKAMFSVPYRNTNGNTERDTNGNTERDTNGNTLQRREEKSRGTPNPPSEENAEVADELELLQPKISGLVEGWSPHFSYGEQTDLWDCFPKWRALSDDDWGVLSRWYADGSERSKYRCRTKSKLIRTVDDELAKAREAGFGKGGPGSAVAGPGWLPSNWREIATSVTGIDCSEMKDWRDVPLDYRGEFERACREASSPEEMEVAG